MTARKPLTDQLPRIEVVHDLPEDQKVCACGTCLKRIGEEVSEKLDYVPAVMQVERHIRPKYACPSCDGEEGMPGLRTASRLFSLMSRSVRRGEVLMP